MLCLTDGPVTIAKFQNKEESREYSSMCSHLTTSLGNMKDCCKTWDLNPREYNRELAVFWIPLADEFIDYWGEDMVPHHTRVAIHKVRMKVHDRVIKWPAILVLGEDRTLTAPVMVGHFERIMGGAGENRGEKAHSHK